MSGVSSESRLLSARNPRTRIPLRSDGGNFRLQSRSSNSNSSVWQYGRAVSQQAGAAEPRQPLSGCCQAWRRSGRCCCQCGCCSRSHPHPPPITSPTPIPASTTPGYLYRDSQNIPSEAFQLSVKDPVFDGAAQTSWSKCNYLCELWQNTKGAGRHSYFSKTFAPSWGAAAAVGPPHFFTGIHRKRREFLGSLSVCMCVCMMEGVGDLWIRGGRRAGSEFRQTKHSWETPIVTAGPKRVFAKRPK